MENAIGMIEFLSIAKGIEATDAMLKTAQVKLLEAKPICPGKYIALIGGEVSAVKSSIQAGKEIAIDSIVDYFIIPNVHKTVFSAICGMTEVSEYGALGTIETYSVASAIKSADESAKSANITLLEIRLGMGLAGKSFITFTGDISAVKESAKRGSEEAKKVGMLTNVTIIPSPHEDLMKTIL